MSFNIDDINVFIFDFDGVLTNNLVHISQDGSEIVSCNRADGLAFDLLNKLNKPIYILSSEKNQVVSKRAKKLKVSVNQGVLNKKKALINMIKKYNYDEKTILYMGNDLNDYSAMKHCGYRICPADSHKKIKEISDIVLKKKGGEGVVRELLEEVLKLDFVSILYDS